MDTVQIAEKLKEIPLAKVFQVSALEELDWLFVDRTLFSRIVKGADPHLDPEKVEEFLRLMSDEDFLELLAPNFLKEGFISLPMERFRKLDLQQGKGSKKGTVYIGRKFLMKKMIGFTQRMDWVLKAMAMDWKGYREEGLAEVYKETFEDNGRLLEELAVDGRVEMEEWTWILDPLTDTLISKYREQVMAKWSNREAVHAFTDRTKERDVE